VKQSHALNFQRGSSTHFLIAFLMDSVTLVHTNQSSKVRADQTTAKPGPFQTNRAISGFPDRVPAALLSSSFTFLMNGAVIESDVAEAAALSPFVREQLSVDWCAREFVILDNKSESESGVGRSGMAALEALQSLLSGSGISVGRWEVLQSGYLGNACLECSLQFCRKSGICATLSGSVSVSVIEQRMNLESADFSILSFEALDDLLSRSSFVIESEDSLLKFILNSGHDYRFLLKHIQLLYLSKEGLSLFADHFKIPLESVWECAVKLLARSPPPPPCFSSPPGQLDSLIISGFPAIFAEFRGKRFINLWRGSRDGFGASDFHGRCDGHANTLTVILDTNGNIFGGFTPVEWESRVSNGKWGDTNNCWKGDESQKSFLFTLKNPQNVAPRRFALKAEKRHAAIYCNSERGPHFGDLLFSIIATLTIAVTLQTFVSFIAMTLDYISTGFSQGRIISESKTLKSLRLSTKKLSQFLGIVKSLIV
jgi:hypothetical protein